MKQFDKLLYELGRLSEYASQYFESRKQILILDVTELISRFLSKLITRVVLLIFIFFAALFGSITLAIGLSMYFGSLWVGFGIVTLLYLVLIGVVLAFRRTLITGPILNMILKDLYQK